MFFFKSYVGTDRIPEGVKTLRWNRNPDSCGKSATGTEKNRNPEDSCRNMQPSRERAVERGTHEKQDRAWRWWKEYTRSIGIKEALFLENFSREQDTSSSMRLPWLSGKQDFQEHLMNNWLQAQSKIPCSMYAQPFEKMGTQTHPSTTTGCLPTFYSKNTDPEEKHKKAIPTSVISELIH